MCASVLIVKFLQSSKKREVLASVPSRAFSCAEILAALYFHHPRDDPSVRWPNRDRLLFSKGHACVALYLRLRTTGSSRSPSC